MPDSSFAKLKSSVFDFGVEFTFSNEEYEEVQKHHAAAFTISNLWSILCIKHNVKSMSKRSSYGLKSQRAAVGGNAVWMSAVNGLTSAARTNSRSSRDFAPLSIERALSVHEASGLF